MVGYLGVYNFSERETEVARYTAFTGTIDVHINKILYGHVWKTEPYILYSAGFHSTIYHSYQEDSSLNE